MALVNPRSVEYRAYLDALAARVKATVIRQAEAAEFRVGFLQTAAVELGWPYKKLSYTLTRHVRLRKWWAKYKLEVSRQRRNAGRRRRAASRPLY